jgi:hypothetical protein
MDFEEETRRLDELQQNCRAISTVTMLKVQTTCAGNETEFQYAMTLVMHNLMEHLGRSLGARKTMEEILQR